MYIMFRNLVKDEFVKGWGNFLGEDDINIVDDIERIYQFRNFICYIDVLEIEIFVFNDKVFDFLGVMYF